MKAIDIWYEVRLRVAGQLKTLHYSASCPEQARAKANGKGQIVTVRKAEYDKMVGNIENINLNVEYVQGSPYNSAVAMDEMIWQKRNGRIKNRRKDKKAID
jgi:hypothetical protein